MKKTACSVARVVGTCLININIHTYIYTYNNQAEQLTILKALKHTTNMQTTEKTVTIYRDSQMTLDSLRNGNMHTFLTEEIRKQLNEMTARNWKIKLRLLKAHAGVRGNEPADKLAKEASANSNIKESYKRIPKRVIIEELEDDSVKKWEAEWTNSTKGTIIRDFFPDVKERLNRDKNVDKKNQLDVIFCILYFSSNSCATCFGQPCAHHQELTTA